MNPIVKDILGKGFKPTKKSSAGIELRRDDGSFAIYKGGGRIEGFIRGGLDDSNSLEEGMIGSGILMAILLGVSTTYFTTDLTIVNGKSMAPTFHTCQVIVNSKVHVPKIITRNCIIKFKDVDGDTCLKRVIGLPGDKISVTDDGLAVNGHIVSKSTHWISGGTPQTDPNSSPPDNSMNFTLEEGQYFVMGDNQDHSVDSRHYGPIKRSSIISVVVK
jgi:signal peptidase I